MKKIVLNISDATYEKLRFETMFEKKDIHQIIQERMFHKPFAIEVQEAFDTFMETELHKMIGE